PDGSITAKGPVTFSEESGPISLDITSGTGDYRGAKGTVGIVFNDDESTDDSLAYFIGTQVEAIPIGAAATGGGGTAHSTDSPLLIAVGIAALAGAAGLFGAAHHAARQTNN